MLIHTTHRDDAMFKHICQSNNWRRTAQRRAVFDCLCGNRDHPSVETIWQSVRKTIPYVSLDSIYRILDAFADVGLITRVGTSKFARYDPDTEPHGHFVCVECGGIFDFPLSESERRPSQCGDLGVVQSVEVSVRGRCRRCAASRPEPSGQ